MNLCLLTGSVIALFLLGLELFHKKRTVFIVASLFVFSPSNLLFSMYVNTEPIAFFPYLLGMLLVIRAFKRTERKQKLLYGLSGGVVLGFSNAIRSNALIALIALIIWGVLFLGRQTKKARQQLWITIGVVLVGLFLFSQLYSIIKTEVFMGKNGGINFGWTLYEGLDKETAGGWRQENSDVLYETIANYPIEEVQTVMLEKAIQRVSDYSPQTWINLLIRKGINIWIYNDYSYAFLMEDNGSSILHLENYLPQISFLVNNTYLLCLMTMVIALLSFFWQHRHKKTDGTMLLIALPLLIMILWHSLGTSIPRYHYYALPTMLLLTFYCAENCAIGLKGGLTLQVKGEEA
ncbi:MAG: phospholipid carrier-dependent glycosyltransferase [Eubacteriales bacterium]|nr:phospholipid carrier-dependent glycosyltransferase [Eubacteriales bacterium]